MSSSRADRDIHPCVAFVRIHIPEVQSSSAILRLEFSSRLLGLPGKPVLTQPSAQRLRDLVVAVQAKATVLACQGVLAFIIIAAHSAMSTPCGIVLA